MIRIGLVGAQFIGNLYAHSMAHVRGAEIAAVASPNTAAEFAARRGISAHFSDYREMIRNADIDAVAIGAPNDLHYDACIAAAEAGKHVLCEKPLAMNLAEAEGMIDACRKAGVSLVYAENLVFAPMYARLRDLARRGSVGRPFLVKHAQCHGGPYSPWFWDVERAGGGVLLDMGCHSIHTVCWVMGEWPVAVTAHIGRYKHAGKGLGEDHTTVLLHFEENRLGIAENSWAMPGGLDHLEAYGPEGRLTANLERGPAVAMYRAPSGETASDPSGTRSGWQFPIYEEAWQFGFPQEIQHFVDVIQGREEPRSTGEDGRKVLEIICAAYESARTGQRVVLPFASTAQKPIDHWLAG
ncbi:MAG TPA: Gfo/Idh/MocA family oxidoreductase [Tepidiformaceae bacterium]|nr:Gfo/Idh/MocA family oxidoreductase [Tepidiformaceae bacterium]